MNTVGIGFIGAWGHWVEAADDFAAWDRVRAVAVAPAYPGEDIAPVLAHPFCGGAEVRMVTREELLRDPAIDLVVISTRLDALEESLLAAARTGKSIIAEKPFARSGAALTQLADELCRSRSPLFPMFSMRSLPAFLAAKEVIAAGVLGEPILANARKSYRLGPRPSWFGDPEVFPGIMAWVGIHAWDIIAFVTGYVPYDATYLKGPATAEYPACERSGAAVARFGARGLATVSVDYCRPDGAPSHGDDWVRVVGTKGTVEANASQGWVRLLDANGEQSLPLPSHAKIHRDFVLSLEGSGRAPITTSEGLAIHSLVLRP